MLVCLGTELLYVSTAGASVLQELAFSNNYHSIVYTSAYFYIPVYTCIFSQDFFLSHATRGVIYLGIDASILYFLIDSGDDAAAPGLSS